MQTHPKYKSILVCKNGNVKRKDKVPIGRKFNGRYELVYISKIGWKRVHFLVLETYRRPSVSREVCRHLNGNSFDNKLYNLKWGSNSENSKDRSRHGTQNPPPEMTEAVKQKISKRHKQLNKFKPRNIKGQFK